MKDEGKGKFKSIIQDFKALCLIVLLIIVWKIVTSFFFHASCPIVLLTGFPCPGCGISRAFFKVLRGDLKSAMVMNPSIFLWLIWGLVFCYERYTRKRQNIVIGTLLITTALCFGLYIYRMKYFFPGELPLTFYYKSIFGQWIPYYHEFISSFLQ